MEVGFRIGDEEIVRKKLTTTTEGTPVEKKKRVLRKI